MTLFSKIPGAALNQGLQFEQVLNVLLNGVPREYTSFGDRRTVVAFMSHYAS